MKIISFAVKNFFSFQDEVKVDVADQGVVMISGDNQDSLSSDSNGAGKTALFVDAVPWALFGMTIREKVFGSTSSEFSKDSVINRDVGKDCCVEVIFSIGKQKYGVQRFRGDSSNGNRVILNRIMKTKGLTQDISGESTKETDQKIVDLIGSKYESFINSSVFGQGPVKRFTQLTDAERRGVLDGFLELSIFTRARDYVKSDWVVLKDREKHHELEKQVLETQLEEQKEEHHAAKEELAEYVQEMKEREKKRAGRIKKREAEKKKVTKHIKELEVMYKQVSEETKTLFKDTMKKAARARAEEKSKSLFGELARARGDLERLNDESEETESRLAKFKEGDECPECLRPMNKADVKKYRKTLIVQKDREDKARAKLVKNVEKNAHDLRANDIKLSDDDERRDEYFSIQKRQSRLERELTNANSRREQTKSELVVLYQEEAVDSKLLQKSRDDVREAKIKWQKIQTRIRLVTDKMQAAKEDKEVAEFWLRGFSNKGIKEICFSECVDYLNDRLAYFSQQLTDGEIFIQFDTDIGEKVTVQVDVKGGAPRYALSSGGESKRIDLCVMLAFQSLVNSSFKSNFSVFDEFDAALDETGVKMFAEFLEEEAAKRGTVFCISHNSDLKSYFSKIWSVQYEDGRSKLEL